MGYKIDFVKQSFDSESLVMGKASMWQLEKARCHMSVPQCVYSVTVREG